MKSQTSADDTGWSGSPCSAPTSPGASNKIRATWTSWCAFADREPTGSYADRYFGLADSLERLFERRVDLVTEESIRNPYLRREVEATQGRCMNSHLPKLLADVLALLREAGENL